MGTKAGVLLEMISHSILWLTFLVVSAKSDPWGKVGTSGGEMKPYSDPSMGYTSVPSADETYESDTSDGGSSSSMSVRGFPGMGDGMIPGFGRRSFGYGKRSFGPESRSFGFGKRSFGPELRSFGLGKRSFGPVSRSFGYGKRSFGPESRSFDYGKRSFGPVSRSFGYGKRSFGPELRSFGYGKRSFGPESRSFGYGKRSFGPESRSFGYGKRSFGYGMRSMGFKKRKGNDVSDRRQARNANRGLLSTSPLQDSKKASERNDPDDASEYPGDNTFKRQKDQKSESRESGLGDFGGGFSNYMKVLEGDPISENQDLQGDVFGGGMSGKYWDMYKGDALGDDESSNEADDDDSELFEEMDERDLRQSLEEDQPEDAPNNERGAAMNDSTDTYVVAFKSPKAQVVQFYNQLKEAINKKDKNEVNSLLSTLETRKLSRKESSTFKERRKLMIIDDEEELMDKGPHDDHSPSVDDVSDIQDKFQDFIDKMNKNIPDPITMKKGISSKVKSISIGGLSDFKVVGKVKKGLGRRWKGTATLPSLVTSISSVSGPAVPFSGKVIGIFKAIRVTMTFKLSDEDTIHITSVRTTSKHVKFIPKFDSSVPLNPWSKVSMSGYLMSRVKKYIPDVVDKTILRLSHIIEDLEKE